jgi:hypothetical protein
MEKILLINQTFAKFMGYEIVEYQNNVYNPIYDGNKEFKTIGEEKSLWGGLELHFTGRFTNAVKYPFDTDFRYLLPIIYKIEKMGYVVAIKGISYQIYKVMDEQNPIVSLVCGDLSKKTELVCSLLMQFIQENNQI